MSEQIERRAMEGIEIRGEGDARRIVGYAAVFDSLSEPLRGNYRETIAPGAFSRALDGGRDVVALVEHEGEPLGRRSAGTLDLQQDSRGLRVEIAPPDTQHGRDTVALVARGDYNGMSFGFTVRRDGQSWRKDEAGGRIREIRSVDSLRDISVVTFPAYLDTAVALRHLQEAEEDEDAEQAKTQTWLELQKKRLDLVEAETIE